MGSVPGFLAVLGLRFVLVVLALPALQVILGIQGLHYVLANPGLRAGLVGLEVLGITQCSLLARGDTCLVQPFRNLPFHLFYRRTDTEQSGSTKELAYLLRQKSFLLVKMTINALFTRNFTVKV